MKTALLIFALTFTMTSLANDKDLTFEDGVKVEKVVMAKTILLKNLMDLHQHFDWEGQRMIAGEFERKDKKSEKSYLEGLRSKLDGQAGYTRF